MTAKISPDLVRESAQAGDEPLPVEHPRTKRVYALLDLERYDVVRRPTAVPPSPSARLLCGPAQNVPGRRSPEGVR